MSLPRFFIDHYEPAQKIELDEETSKHIVSVLRMKEGEKLQLTDGKGNLLTSEIIRDHKKHCEVKIIDSHFKDRDPRKITIGISLLKNASRFEWFLEKSTELGIAEFIPLICERTEKQKFRFDRMKSIVVSAMVQSQQCWLPHLHEPVEFNKIVTESHQHQKFIAHCIEDEKRDLADLVNESLSSQIILIGPEGDFTTGETRLAISHHFDAVSLGNTRLRAETAGVVAATLLKLG